MMEYMAAFRAWKIPDEAPHRERDVVALRMARHESRGHGHADRPPAVQTGLNGSGAAGAVRSHAAVDGASVLTVRILTQEQEINLFGRGRLELATLGVGHHHWHFFILQFPLK